MPKAMPLSMALLWKVVFFKSTKVPSAMSPQIAEAAKVCMENKPTLSSDAMRLFTYIIARSNKPAVINTSQGKYGFDAGVSAALGCVCELKNTARIPMSIAANCSQVNGAKPMIMVQAEGMIMDNLLAIVVGVRPAKRVEVPAKKKMGKKQLPTMLAASTVSMCFI